MDYSSTDAAAYGDFALRGSTYEISLLPAISHLGILKAATVLDFGCGTGRSARELATHGARVVAVDINPNMLRAAAPVDSVVFVQVGDLLPIRDASVDSAICANVLSEFMDLSQVEQACSEVARVVSPGGRFAVVVPNPDAFKSDFVSYRYLPSPKPLKKGDVASCLIKGPEPFIVEDYFWLERDYISTLERAGFRVVEVERPRADQDDAIRWIDEVSMPPDLVIKCVRP